MKNQLVVLENLNTVPFFTKGDDVDDILRRIKEDALLHVPDLSTGKGRAAITANITRVTESKTYLEAKGKELAAEYKAIPAKIDQNRKKVKDFLAELQVELREPLTNYENEQAEIKAEKIADDLAEKKAKEKDELWDFALMELKVFNIELEAEKARLAEEERVEQARLAQAKIDSDALIAKQAAEAATIEAERIAQKAIDDAQELKQKAINDKIQADKDLLASQAREKLLNEQAEQDKLNNEWLAYISEAYQYNDQLNVKAEQKRQQDIAEQSRLASIETERLAGIERARLAQKAIDDAAAVRLADTNYKSSVKKEILDILLANNVPEGHARTMIQLAANKKLPKLTINY